MYLLQIKAMELELIDNAINWSPSNLFREMKQQSPEKASSRVVQCEAQIVCKKMPWCDDFLELFNEACKKCGIELRQKAQITVSKKVLDKYKREI